MNSKAAQSHYPIYTRYTEWVIKDFVNNLYKLQDIQKSEELFTTYIESHITYIEKQSYSMLDQ